MGARGRGKGNPFQRVPFPLPRYSLPMNFELFIARRYLRAKRKQAFISVMSVFSMVGVALGVGALIIAMAIMNGFTTELRERILGATPQIVVRNIFEGIQDYEKLRGVLMEVPGVTNATPFLYTELAISAPNGRVKGLMTRGVDPSSGPLSIAMLNDLKSGSVENLYWPDPDGGEPQMGIIIGEPLARTLQVGVGDRVNLLAAGGRRTAAGVTPRVVPFIVAGTFETGMVQYDTSLAYVSLDAARNLIGMRDQRVHGMELTVNDVFKADKIAAQVEALLGARYDVSPWMTSNASLFQALQLEKFAMGLVLFIIILVASFSIIASLIMLVMEKTKDIAILMSMGATRFSISKIFLQQGLIIGVVGTSIGFALGITLCLLLKRYKFVELPPGAYPMEYVPVLLQWQDLLVTVVGSVLICFLATIYPAWKASRLVPAEALRSE